MGCALRNPSGARRGLLPSSSPLTARPARARSGHLPRRPRSRGPRAGRRPHGVAELGDLLDFINHHLASRYTSDFDAFVTAFYAIYDPSTRELIYANAGHNPPRVRRRDAGSIMALEAVGNLPLGVSDDVRYDEATVTLRPGDQVSSYTDGITEATAAASSRGMFGTGSLDEALANCHLDTSGLIRTVLDAVDQFPAGAPAADDRTLLVEGLAGEGCARIDSK